MGLPDRDVGPGGNRLHRDAAGLHMAKALRRLDGVVREVRHHMFPERALLLSGGTGVCAVPGPSGRCVRESSTPLITLRMVVDRAILVVALG